jgi:hypothetical protein
VNAAKFKNLISSGRSKSLRVAAHFGHIQAIRKSPATRNKSNGVCGRSYVLHKPHGNLNMELLGLMTIINSLPNPAVINKSSGW